MKNSLQTLLSLKYNLNEEKERAIKDVACGNQCIEYVKGIDFAIKLITKEAVGIEETIKSVDRISREVFGNINPPTSDIKLEIVGAVEEQEGNEIKKIKLTEVSIVK